MSNLLGNISKWRIRPTARALTHQNQNEDLLLFTNYETTLFICSYVIVEPADGNYGSRQDDGHFNGMIGMVERKVTHC